MFWKSQEQLIFEIHHEFDTASQKLLDFAFETRQKIKEDDKAERLRKLGFTRLHRVVVNDGNKRILGEIKASVDIIEHYQKTYPFQKFVTEDQLDRICKKYGLIYAPVNHYLKDVPEKNIREIENTPELRNGDYPSNKYHIKYTGKLKNGTTRKQKKLYRKGITAYIQPDRWGEIRGASEFVNITGLNCHKYTSTDDWKVNQISLNGLFIAAPKSHFDLNGLDQSSKFSFNLFTPVIDKDPIVFRYVKGGIQVLSKWGLEASDEELVNPITN
jgi:hypothetical protein